MSDELPRVDFGKRESHPSVIETEVRIVAIKIENAASSAGF